MFIVPKSVGLSGRNTGLVVETLGGAVGEGAAGAEPVEEEPAVLAEGGGEGLERREPRAHSLGGPAVEEAPRPPRRLIGPEGTEAFLEEVGADGSEVDADELAEAGVLVVRQILAPLEKDPSCLGEHGVLAACSKGADLLAADGVDGLAQELGDVKAVEDVYGGGGALLDDREERLPHVAGDELDGLRAGVTEQVEEVVEARGRAGLSDPEQAPAVVVDLVDEGHV